MTGERVVPRAVLGFVVVAPLVLATVIARSPDTHGHTWQTFHPDYARTPLDTVGEADLDRTLADLAPFSFPAPPRPQVAASVADRAPAPAAMTGMPGMAAMARPAPAAEAAVQKIALATSEYAIAPANLEVKAGVPVELTVTNEGKQVHGVWMPEFGIAQDIRPGKTQVFKFTPDKPGRFRYVCSYNLCGTDEQHARMVGFMTVR